MRTLLLLAVLTFAPSLHAGLDSVGVAQGLQRWLDGTRSLERDFEQSLASGALGAGLEESGRFYLERPGKMRWDYDTPERKVAIVIGSATRLWIEEDAQMWEGQLESDALLALLLTGERPLSELFQPALLATPELGGNGRYRLQLVPLEAADAFQQVLLTLGSGDFSIDEAEVLDAAGNRMIYRFGEARRNQGLAADTFEFEPPAGTEILRR
jgi:outer membrane lipoprotein carrier protein